MVQILYILCDVCSKEFVKSKWHTKTSCLSLYIHYTDNEDEDDEDEDGQDGDEKMTAECSSNQSGEMEWTDDIDNANHPALSTGDSLASYWFRTREHWLETVCDGDVEEDERADELNEKAQKLARAWFERQQQKEE